MKRASKQRSWICMLVLGLAITSPLLAQAQRLDLPERPANATGGSAFAKSIADLPIQEREETILSEVMRGNVPEWLRKLVPLPVQVEIDGRNLTATLYVAPDYLAVGSDDDYFLTPLTPYTAQKIADRLGCTLPTRKMVDEIYEAAKIKLEPSPIPPTPEMTTVPVFIRHNEIVREARAKYPVEGLVAGDKKDIVITSRLATSPGKVAIYGWHRSDGKPIQPLYLGHTAAWADYSHGVRLIQSRMEIDGKATTVQAVLADPTRYSLLSDEGPIAQARYDLKEFQTLPITDGNERETTLNLDQGVRVVVNEPARMDPAKTVQLVIYALPNGNTIEQTIGRRKRANDDWHFDIQHIGAQTRFLRERLKDRNLVVAYIENSQKSWPAWRGKNGSQGLPPIVDAVKSRYIGRKLSVVLNGHSGGGSFVLGYLACFADVPSDVERIAFLDSDYNYATERDAEKLTRWLQDDRHYLCVLAYNDAIALLNGKTFVSAEGGTWGRSHLMLSDLSKAFVFTERKVGELETHTALNGRAKFFFHPNLDRKILHTVQIERNGFIESLLSGTPLDEKGYRYFGERAYGDLIRD